MLGKLCVAGVIALARGCGGGGPGLEVCERLEYRDGQTYCIPKPGVDPECDVFYTLLNGNVVCVRTNEPSQPQTVGEVTGGCGAFTRCLSCLRGASCAWCDGRCRDSSEANAAVCDGFAENFSECSTLPTEPDHIAAPSFVEASEEYSAMIAISFEVPEGAKYFRLYGLRVDEPRDGTPPAFSENACAFTYEWELVPEDGTVWLENHSEEPYWFWVRVARDVLGNDASEPNEEGAFGMQCDPATSSGCVDATASPTFMPWPWC